MKEVHKTSIGGQALIEGILMRGPGKMSIVVRRENGEMVIKEQVVVSLTDRYPILKRPFIRGIIGLFESMKLGMGALSYSADIFAEEEKESEKEKEKEQKGLWAKVLGRHKETVETALTMLFSLSVAILFFFLNFSNHFPPI